MIAVTICIVNYRSLKNLKECIKSILTYSPNFKYEIIVFDNSYKQKTESELKRLYPSLVYLTKKINLGFGKANNYIAEKATGNILVFLNPDCLIIDNSSWNFIRQLQGSNIGIAAPKIVDNRNSIEQSISKLPTPLNSLFYFTFLHKIFPFRLFWQDYWYKNYTFKAPKNVEFVSGACFAIRKRIFNKIGGFDDKIFLYFEDTDLCYRIAKEKMKTVIDPSSTIFHIKEGSEFDSDDRLKSFQISRSYYYHKHFNHYPSSISTFILEYLEKWAK